jgi:DNA end-binding protein Ku
MAGMRSTGSATITFCLINIPVKLYTPVSASEGVKFNQLTPKGNRVRQKTFDAVSGEEVAYDQLDKGYEVAKDEFIRITKDELKALDAECESKTVDISEFVDAKTVDALFVEKSYYLGPDKGAEKGYALLAESMTEQGKVAVAQWNARGKEHLVTIRPYRGGLVMQQMYYANEVRSFDEVKPTATKPVSDAERNMANQLITTLSTAAFDPSKFKDSWTERVKAAIEEKKASGVIKTSATAPATVSNVVDLSALLAASLANAASRKAATQPADKK